MRRMDDPRPANEEDAQDRNPQAPFRDVHPDLSLEYPIAQGRSAGAAGWGGHGSGRGLMVCIKHFVFLFFFSGDGGLE